MLRELTKVLTINTFNFTFSGEKVKLNIIHEINGTKLKPKVRSNN